MSSTEAAASPQPLLRIDRLTAGYEGRTVLYEVSLDVPEGSLVTMIGPNGHGKTTLLRCISGLVPPTGGEIRLDGQSITNLDPSSIVARGVVHVPQGDLLFPEMSVYDNLVMGAYLRQTRAGMAERLDEIYALLPRLAERRDQIARTLSGGERRMLALGRGLLTGGRILLLDEPSLGLAPAVIEQIYGIIGNLRRSGRTILLVEESVSRVIDLSARIYLLDTGRVVWEGDGKELQGQPQILETYLGD